MNQAETHYCSTTLGSYSGPCRPTGNFQVTNEMSISIKSSYQNIKSAYITIFQDAAIGLMSVYPFGYQSMAAMIQMLRSGAGNLVICVMVGVGKSFH